MPKRTINEYKKEERKKVIFGSWEYMKIYHKSTLDMLGRNAFRVVAKYALEYFNKMFPLRLGQRTAISYIMSKIKENELYNDLDYVPATFNFDNSSFYDLAKLMLEEDE